MKQRRESMKPTGMYETATVPTANADLQLRQIAWRTHVCRTVARFLLWVWNQASDCDILFWRNPPWLREPRGHVISPRKG